MEKINNNEISLVDFNPEKDQLMELWYKDCIEFGHGMRVSIKIKDILYNKRSKFQEIAVLESEKLGKILVIDGITMLTEWDESAYHEMIVHVPMLVHPNPKDVLIIGGGDGGTAREVLKHPEVENIYICELDEEVVKACREYIPSLASSFDNPKVKVFYEDGAKFVADKNSEYDVIIVDSTDPIGPGKILFQRPFYENMKNALKEDGIAVTQCESIYLHGHVIRSVYSFAKEIYPKVGYYNTLIPTYPSGMIGFFFCSLKYDPINDINLDRAKKLPDLKYYTPELHRASFTLPLFATKYFK